MKSSRKARDKRHRGPASGNQLDFLGDLIEENPKRASKIGLRKKDLKKLSMGEASALIDAMINNS